MTGKQRRYTYLPHSGIHCTNVHWVCTCKIEAHSCTILRPVSWWNPFPLSWAGLVTCFDSLLWQEWFVGSASWALWGLAVFSLPSWNAPATCTELQTVLLSCQRSRVARGPASSPHHCLRHVGDAIVDLTSAGVADSSRYLSDPRRGWQNLLLSPADHRRIRNINLLLLEVTSGNGPTFLTPLVEKPVADVEIQSSQLMFPGPPSIVFAPLWWWPEEWL